MKLQLLIAASAVMLLSATQASAQDNSRTVLRQVVTTYKPVIVANSPEDLALQEEIRKIRAYNASVDSKVGISDAHTVAAPSYSPSQRVVNTQTYSNGSAYQGRKVQLFGAPATTITYATAGNHMSSVPITRQVAVTPAQTTQTYQPITAAQYTRIHRVVENDTLYNLAKRSCVSVQDIQAQNALNSNSIQIGQAITMPASRCNSVKTLATTTIAAPAQSRTQSNSDFGIVRRVEPIQAGIKVRQGNAYAVLPKDSLYSIGKRYCLSAQDLAGFNGISTADPIQPGQVLRLPADSCTK